MRVLLVAATVALFAVVASAVDEPVELASYNVGAEAISQYLDHVDEPMLAETAKDATMLKSKKCRSKSCVQKPYSIVGELVPHEPGMGVKVGANGQVDTSGYDKLVRKLRRGVQNTNRAIAELAERVKKLTKRDTAKAKNLSAKIQRLKATNANLRKKLSVVEKTPGPKGAPGPRGKRGVRGRPGAPGADGKRGKRGAPGPRGRRGLPGLAGANGRPGADGRAGPTGPEGLRGRRGARGSAGPRGAPGALGARGPQGVEGAKGRAGPRGPTGPRGAAGARGPAGPPGAQGFMGARGKAGFPGLQGEPGISGKTGRMGPPGRRGIVGPDGRTGPPGPQGPRGITGVKGPRGARGPTGRTGYSGPQGSVGEPGAPGLPGPRGFPGRNGANGKNGAAGRDGTPGKPGLAGPPGRPGIRGEAGPRGKRGRDGYAGYVGERGVMGPTGDAGARGPPGPPGQRGPQGKKGKRRVVKKIKVEMSSSTKKLLKSLKKKMKKIRGKVRATRAAVRTVRTQTRAAAAAAPAARPAGKQIVIKTLKVTYPKLKAPTPGQVALQGKLINYVNGMNIDKVDIVIKARNGDTPGDEVKKTTSNQVGSFGVMLDAGDYFLYAKKSGFVMPPAKITLPQGLPRMMYSGGMSPTIKNKDGVRIVVVWGEHPADLDSHLYFPNNKCKIIYYNKKCTNWGEASLDLDSTRGNGPETITIYKSKKGTYEYKVHQYSNDGTLATSKAKVMVFTGDKVTVFRAEKAAAAPNGGNGKIAGKTWSVFKWVVGDDGKGQIVPF